MDEDIVMYTVKYYSAIKKNRASMVAQMVKKLPEVQETQG